MDSSSTRTPKGRSTLTGCWAPVQRGVLDLGFEDLERLTADEYDTACNWKLAMDTFGETYHFNSLHRTHSPTASTATCSATTKTAICTG